MSKSNVVKKTILQVVPSLISGGVERGTIEIAKRLIDEGHVPIVVSSGGSLVNKLLQIGVKHIKLNVASKNPFVIWLNSKKIIKIIKEYNVDIIHARSRAPAWSCYIAAKKTNIKFVTTFHGIYSASNFLKRYYNSIMLKGKIVIAVSNFVKKHILSKYEVDPNKLVVIHRGVDHNYFNPDVCSEAQLIKLREKYNLPNANLPVILLPSRMTYWKGQLNLVTALSKIKDMSFYCLIVGELAKHPDYVQKIQQLIRTYKMQDKIQIFSQEPEMVKLYAIADLVVSTSIEPEAFGRTIIEGQAMKKLVIATNIGGACETIIHGKTGYHVLPNNPEDLAAKIKHCLEILKSSEAVAIQENARQSVIQNFSLQSMLDSTLKIYDVL